MFLIRLKIKRFFAKIVLRKARDKTTRQIGGTGGVVSALASFLTKFIILLFFGAIILFPFYYMISVSLMTYGEVSDVDSIHLVPKVPQWNNFVEAFQEGYLSAALWTSLITLISVLGKVFITMLLGYAFSFPRWSGKKTLWYTLLGLLMLPEVALMGGQYFVMVQLGWQSGIQVVFALFIPFVASVFSAFMFKNAFSSIQDSIRESAAVDGASGAKYFVRVAMPMVAPTTWIVVILTAFAAWNSYMWPALLLAGQDIQVINTWVFLTGIDPSSDESRLLVNVRIAATILAIAPMLIVYFIFRGRIMAAISRQGSASKG